MTSVVIIGGGPGGYEAALVARQLGADVTVIDRDGLGGAAVLTDVVPSKGLISVAEVLTRFRESARLGIDSESLATVNLNAVNERLRRLAAQQSADIHARLNNEQITVVRGTATLTSDREVLVSSDAGEYGLSADIVLIATGAQPRVLATAIPDGRRILTWKQLYDLEELPQHLIVVGSGVTGAEFASAYHALGSEVTLVSSREHVLPGQDSDAAQVIEEVFARRGITVVSKARAESVQAGSDGVRVQLADGRVIEGSHCLMAVGSLPNTSGLGLDAAGVETDERGFVQVDRVSRTSARGVYAAGDCTGVEMLASVAAMQGRIAMWHALGDAVTPLDLDTVAACIFTDPEIASVGITQRHVLSGDVEAEVMVLPLRTNADRKSTRLNSSH